MAGTVHVIGAGLAGLSAAVRLAEAGRSVRLYEATKFVGGRCRSYYDAQVGLTIDNGNHLLLSGNHAALDFVRIVGGGDGLTGPPQAEFPFADLATGARWTLRPNAGRLPWWILRADRRVPGTRARDYLAALGILRAGPGATIGSVMTCAGPLYERLWRPVLLSALNTDPPEADAGLAGAILRETLGAGGAACRPLVAGKGLSAAFIDPATRYLGAHGAELRLETNLHALAFEGDRVAALDLGGERVAVGPEDGVVLAVPAWIARQLVPDLQTPDVFRAIVNLHFNHAPPAGQPPVLGVIGGTVEWLFAFEDRLSVTISAADRLIAAPRQDLAKQIWREVSALTGLSSELPPWQIVRERRATFAALPGEVKKRPKPATRFRNLVLAGDWTDTGLPATIEGAVRSGRAAASVLMAGA